MPSALCALLFTLLVLPVSAAATSTQAGIDSAIAKALAYAPTQHDPATGEPPTYERIGFYSGEWLASGYAAAGLSAADVGDGDNPSFQDFLFGDAAYWDDPSPIAADYTGRLILTAHAAGIDTARMISSLNLPAELVEVWRPLAGGFGEPSTFSTVWGVLALRTTPLPAWALHPALTYLRADQHADGGWSFSPLDAGDESNPDITAAAIGALCAAGAPAYDPVVRKGLTYLNGLQVKETGAIDNPEFGENIDTSTWTVNALNACGIDPQSSDWTTADGKTPIDHILSLQLEDGGFAWVTGEPWFPPSTGHALRALTGYGFVVGPAARQDPTQPPVRPVPTVAAGTLTPHVLAIELAPGNVRLCAVTAPVGAPLTELLAAARDSAQPAGCVTSFSVTGGEVVEIDGVSAPGPDQSWLARLDRSAPAVAASQPVGFGELVSLWIGTPPPAAQAAGSVGGASPGPAGKRGKSGKRGRRGKPGRNGRISCMVRRHAGKRKVRCSVRRGGRSGSQPRALPASKPSR